MDITIEKERDVIELVLYTWPSTDLMRLAQEEGAEFITAINHLCRQRDGALSEVIEEYCDLQIMLGVVGAILCNDFAAKDRIEDMLVLKLARFKAHAEAGEQL